MVNTHKSNSIDGMTIGGLGDILESAGFRRKNVEGIEGSIVGAKVVWSRKAKGLTEYFTYTVRLKS